MCAGIHNIYGLVKTAWILIFPRCILNSHPHVDWIRIGLSTAIISCIHSTWQKRFGFTRLPQRPLPSSLAHLAVTSTPTCAASPQDTTSIPASLVTPGSVPTTGVHPLAHLYARRGSLSQPNCSRPCAALILSSCTSFCLPLYCEQPLARLHHVRAVTPATALIWQRQNRPRLWAISTHGWCVFTDSPRPCWASTQQRLHNSWPMRTTFCRHTPYPKVEGLWPGIPVAGRRKAGDWLGHHQPAPLCQDVHHAVPTQEILLLLL